MAGTVVSTESMTLATSNFSNGLGLNIVKYGDIEKIVDIPKEVRDAAGGNGGDEPIASSSPFIDGVEFVIRFDESMLLASWAPKPSEPILKDGKVQKWVPRIHYCLAFYKVGADGSVSTEPTVAFMSMILPSEKSRYDIDNNTEVKFDEDAINNRFLSLRAATCAEDAKKEFGCDAIRIKIRRSSPFKIEGYNGRTRIKRLVNLILVEQITNGEVEEVKDEAEANGK